MTITLSELHSYAALVNAAISGAKVGWVDDENPEGVSYGTARRLSLSGGTMARSDSPADELFLEITTTRGVEVRKALPALVVAHSQGLFCVDVMIPAGA